MQKLQTHTSMCIYIHIYHSLSIYCAFKTIMDLLIKTRLYLLKISNQMSLWRTLLVIEKTDFSLSWTMHLHPLRRFTPSLLSWIWSESAADKIDARIRTQHSKMHKSECRYCSLHALFTYSWCSSTEIFKHESYKRRPQKYCLLPQQRDLA